MASGTELESTPSTPVQTVLAKVGPHATKAVLGAAALGLVAAFLPAVTMTFKLFGSTVSETLGVWQDWRGKLALLAYLGVGAMAGLMLWKPGGPARKLSLACLVTSGVAVLLAVWLPLSIGGGIDPELGGITVGVGCYVNVLASLALAAGSALQAKRANVF
jgi:hypothetical protein